MHPKYKEEFFIKKKLIQDGYPQGVIQGVIQDGPLCEQICFYYGICGYVAE